MTGTPIADRILDAFPSGSYGLLGLLRLLDIVETSEIDTAAVSGAALPLLQINPAFVDAHASTPEHLLMLVMHELHHVLLGHTRLFPRITPADNLVFDAVINALLCRMFPAPEHTSFFTRFYPDDRFPECLLRPPEGWTPAAPAVAPPALAGPEMYAVSEVYRALYSDTGAGYHELYSTLRRRLRSVDGVRLIGSHEKEPDELRGTVFDAVRSIVEHWPQPPDPIRGRSWSEVLRVHPVKPRPSNRAVLRGVLRRVAGPGEGARLNTRSTVTMPVASPIPAGDRRAVVLRALGTPQLLYNRQTRVYRRDRCEPVHVYVDVSGSIGACKGALYGAVLDCREIVHPAIHLFSTVVHDVTPGQLRAGECRTTGGTSIECVAAHMQTNRIRRAVLLTDGWVGSPGPTAQKILFKVLLGVALTPGGGRRDDLRRFARFWAQLEGEQ